MRTIIVLIILICNSCIYSVYSQDLSILDISNCNPLSQTGKTEAQKIALRNNYQILLGIVSDLGKYRQQFLKSGDLINLFPTAYYHTTLSEMKRISEGNFNYPIEKMLQMIAFYDAYKRNRDFWDKGQKNLVEKHWMIHFEYAERIASEINFLCARVGFVLATGIAAHVKYDLPRAFKFAYKNRFTTSLKATDPDYLLDFTSTNELFAITKHKTIDDVGNARTFCPEWMLNAILNWKDGITTGMSNEAMTEYSRTCKAMGFQELLTDDDVILLRQEAWRKSYENEVLTGVNNQPLTSQPILNHQSLQAIGQNICGINNSSKSGVENVIRMREFNMPSNPVTKLDSKILISKDEYVYIECAGKIKIGFFAGSVSGNGTTNPFLNPFNKYPFNHGALMFILGDEKNACTALFTNEISDMKQAFYASAASQSRYFSPEEKAVVGGYFIAKETGTLHFDVNDNDISDNAGFFKIRVYTIKKEDFLSRNKFNQCPSNISSLADGSWAVLKDDILYDGQSQRYAGISSTNAGCICAYDKTSRALDKKISHFSFGTWLALKKMAAFENSDYLQVILDLLPGDLFNSN